MSRQLPIINRVQIDAVLLWRECGEWKSHKQRVTLCAATPQNIMQYVELEQFEHIRLSKPCDINTFNFLFSRGKPPAHAMEICMKKFTSTMFTSTLLSENKKKSAIVHLIPLI